MLIHLKSLNSILKFRFCNTTRTCTTNRTYSGLHFKKEYGFDIYDSLENAINTIGGQKTAHITDYIDFAITKYTFDNKGKIEIFINAPWSLKISSDNQEIFEKIISIIDKKE